MTTKTNYIIDFDSTLVTIESLDELITLSIQSDPNRDAKLAELAEITNQGMAGEIGFDESLRRRVAIASPHRHELEQILNKLSQSLSPSALRHVEWFKNHRDNIYVISGGFEEYVKPTIKLLGLDEDKVYANKFIFDGENIVGFESDRFTAQAGGKPKQVKLLNLDGRVIMIGDGYTDYEVRRDGEADEFWACTETVSRPRVIAVADKVIDSFDQVISN